MRVRAHRHKTQTPLCYRHPPPASKGPGLGHLRPPLELLAPLIPSMSSQPQTNTAGGQKPARRKNQNPGFGYALPRLSMSSAALLTSALSATKVSRADQGTFQDGVFTLPETSAPSTSAPSRSNNGNRRHNKPMSKSLEASSPPPSTTNHGASPSISSKAGRPRSSSGKHLSFAPDATLVQIHHFPPTSPISYPPSSSHAEDSAASSAASKPSHWAGGAYANSPDPTSIPLPTFGPKPAAGLSVLPVATAPHTAPTPANFSAQASLDLRRLLNIPAPPLSMPLNVTA